MKLFGLVLLFLFPATTLSQAPLDAGLKVNGLALGATREQVISKLGKPTREIKGGMDECVGADRLTLQYPGLEFKLWDDSEKPGKFTVGMFEVTSAKWDASGARVGQASSAVKKMFGTRYTAAKDSQTGETVWDYAMDDDKGPGNTNFTIRNGKVVRIFSMWLMC